MSLDVASKKSNLKDKNLFLESFPQSFLKLKKYDNNYVSLNYLLQIYKVKFTK